MSDHAGYKIEPFSNHREMVAVSSDLAREKNTIHLMTETDITAVRERMAQHREQTGESLSLTAYVVTCLARALADFPGFNAFRKGRQLVVFEDVTISIAFEREINGENVPEPIAIQAINRKTYHQVNDELRAFQSRSGEKIGSAMGTAWLRFVPASFLRTLTRLAYRDIGVWQRFGVIGVTAVGMFASGPTWLVPLTASTVTVAIGSIVKRPLLIDGVIQEREICVSPSPLITTSLMEPPPPALQNALRRFCQVVMRSCEKGSQAQLVTSRTKEL